jgi:hypothetical protein
VKNRLTTAGNYTMAMQMCAKIITMQSQVLRNSTRLTTTRNGLRWEQQRFTVPSLAQKLFSYNAPVFAEEVLSFVQVEKGVNTALTCLTSSNGTCGSSVVKFSQVRKCVLFICGVFFQISCVFHLFPYGHYIFLSKWQKLSLLMIDFLCWFFCHITPTVFVLCNINTYCSVLY